MMESSSDQSELEAHGKSWLSSPGNGVRAPPSRPRCPAVSWCHLCPLRSPLDLSRQEFLCWNSHFSTNPLCSRVPASAPFSGRLFQMLAAASKSQNLPVPLFPSLLGQVTRIPKSRLCHPWSRGSSITPFLPPMFFGNAVRLLQ